MEEILDAQRSGCPPEYFNIPIPKGHSLFDPNSHGDRELPFLRTRYDMRTGNSPNAPREQVGDINLLPAMFQLIHSFIHSFIHSYIHTYMSKTVCQTATKHNEIIRLNGKLKLRVKFL